MEHRIVSLIPSATEIVAALGYEESLVGRSHECDFPPSIERLPVCSKPRIDVSGSSNEIDQLVKTSLRDALSIYTVFRDELERLTPTLLITQSQCDVCAVNLEEVQAAVCDMIGSQPEIVSLEPMALSDIWSDIQSVADALDDAVAGHRLVESLRGRLKLLAQNVPESAARPSVVCIEWLEPLMPAGNWIPELVELAGGTSLLSEAGKHSPWMTWDDLTTVDPDFIVIMPCGFDIERTQRELHLLIGHPQWSNLKAVRDRNVFLTDGHQYFNRPGPRVVESAEILAEILHGPAIHFGHEGAGWVRC
ncbi:MAG: cobalamin-binding protein [Planctomycetota bacterium]|nr:cobalamin-binding protein [Planctomycetota bacterium]MDA0918003.1 cobalamin-binding protein [Planctomycetota bacterium]